MSLDELLAVWDHLPAAEAVARAWADPGPNRGTWHVHARRDVGCARFLCSCRGARGCTARPAKRL